jgi:hypothetical protein
VVEDRLHELGDQVVGVVRDRRRRVGAHAAGVRAGVALAEALVVLRERQGDGAHPVAQRDNEHSGPLRRSSSRNGPVVARIASIVAASSVGNGHTLAGGEPVELDDDGTVEVAPPGDGGVVIVERGEGRGPGIPSDVASSRRTQVFDDSSRASFAVGPKQGSAPNAHSSATPSTSAASGPGNTRSVSSAGHVTQLGGERTSWPW